jgi:hypothetical protein
LGGLVTNRSFDQKIADLSRAQCFAFSRAQALAAGATDDLLCARLKSGLLVSLASGVYGPPGMPESRRRRQWVAGLALGGRWALSFVAAAGEHGWRGFTPGKLEFTVKNHAHPRVPGVISHEIDDLFEECHAHHLVDVDGLPLTSEARTAVDIAGVPKLRTRLAHALDDATTAGSVTYTSIGKVMKDVSRKGKPGMKWLAAFLDEHTRDDLLPTGHGERPFFRALRDAGEPLPVSQAPFPGWTRPRNCVDGLYVEAWLIVEIDSRRWHQRRMDTIRDTQRDQDAHRLGFLVHRIYIEDLLADPIGVIATLREVRLLREALFRRD